MRRTLMKVNIVFHSHSGKTKNIAEKIQQATGGSLTEVSPQKPYSSLTVVPVGCYRALRGVADPVIPDPIDVSGADLIVLASPVWAGRPSPVINGAVGALSGSRGKKAFIVVTCNDTKSGDEALIPFRKSLEAKGVAVTGAAVLDRHHVSDASTLSALISDIKSAGGE
jgi:multimeric flavodoxin WrbA